MANKQSGKERAVNNFNNKNTLEISANLKLRHKKERLFSIIAKMSNIITLAFLLIILVTIFHKGYKSFFTTKIALKLEINKQETNNTTTEYYRSILSNSIKSGFSAELKDCQCSIDSFLHLISKNALVEIAKYHKSADFLKNQSATNHQIWLTASSKVDLFFKYRNGQGLNKQQIQLILNLIKDKQIKTAVNWQFLKGGDSLNPENVGIFNSLFGSLAIIFICLITTFPIAVMSAFYLEEFAPKNKFIDFLEISINNLAAIPSIIYGILGLAFYLQIMHLPRASSLVAGITLAMLVLPIIIIATRSAISSIPKHLRDAAIGIGASKSQLIVDHLFPLSIPSIMTGTILAVSRAIGETAPLLMIGMVAFIIDLPTNFMQPATALPVQIYLWSDSIDLGFAEKTAAAIIFLLIMLILLNFTAIFIRKKFEKTF